MASFSDYLEALLLNHIFRATANTAPTTIYVALFTAAPTDAGGGTQVAAVGGYVRKAVTFGAPSAGVIANTGAVSWTAAGAAFGTVVAIGHFDALTGGNMLAWKAITSAVVGDGDTLDFAIGQLTIALD